MDVAVKLLRKLLKTADLIPLIGPKVWIEVWGYPTGRIAFKYLGSSLELDFSIPVTLGPCRPGSCVSLAFCTSDEKILRLSLRGVMDDDVEILYLEISLQDFMFSVDRDCRTMCDSMLAFLRPSFEQLACSVRSVTEAEYTGRNVLNMEGMRFEMHGPLVDGSPQFEMLMFVACKRSSYLYPEFRDPFDTMGRKLAAYAGLVRT